MQNDAIFLNQTTIPIRWVDIDAYQHLNNAHYFNAMSEARAHLFGKIARFNSDIQFVLVQTQCEFKKPYYYPGMILIKQYLVHMRKTSFDLLYEFYDAHGSFLHAKGSAKIVCYSPSLKKAVRVPENIIELLN